MSLFLPPSPWYAHDDDHVVEAHPGDVDEVDGQDLVAELKASAAVDGAVDGDAGDEDPVRTVHPVPLPDVQPEGLTRALHDLNEARYRIRVLKK